MSLSRLFLRLLGFNVVDGRNVPIMDDDSLILTFPRWCPERIRDSATARFVAELENLENIEGAGIRVVKGGRFVKISWRTA